MDYWINIQDMQLYCLSSTLPLPHNNVLVTVLVVVAVPGDSSPLTVLGGDKQ